MSKPTAQTNRAEITELRSLIARLADECGDLRVRVSSHSQRIEQMEVAKPAELRRLNTDTIAAAVAADPYVRFEVLKDWHHGHHEIAAGSIVRADHLPFLADYVRAGLMLGVPSDQSKVIERMRAEAQARADAALSETRLAEASAARAESAAAEARAAAAAIGDTAPATQPAEEARELSF